jgi:hypothetical protein
VQTCLHCQVNKQPTTKPAGVAHVLPIPERPWQSVAIDFIVPITVSQGYTNIMVIMDRFSGFLLCFPLKNKFSAVDVADTVLLHSMEDMAFQNQWFRTETHALQESSGNR